MASCWSSIFNISPFFSLFAFSLSYFGLPFFNVFLSYLPNFQILLLYLFFLFNNNLFIVFFNLFLRVHSLKTGSHVSLMQWSISFQLPNLLSQKVHQSSVFSSSISFFTLIFQCQYLDSCNPQTFFFMGVLVAVIS